MIIGCHVDQVQIYNNNSRYVRAHTITCTYHVCCGSLSHLSRVGLCWFGSGKSIQQVHVPSQTGQVEDAPLPLARAAQTAQTGDHMTETAETVWEGVMTNAWTGSELGQRVHRVYQSPGEYPPNGAGNINHFTLDRGGML